MNTTNIRKTNRRVRRWKKLKIRNPAIVLTIFGEGGIKP
jgi:hypothetical protein